ncbi:MAG: 16S rRNA (uracil(1498)-N(3))-methyltransferase [Caulobacteraceae bacterium]|nr:16S rRNA (uracil(1498)-N(3))-methyltransferase [Caulobacteraceae bacterium]
MIRLFIPDDLRPGAEISLAIDQARYLTAVMRQVVGDAIALFNGRDGEWRAIIVEASKKGCRLRAERMLRPQSSPPDLDLVVALIKRARLETIIEKATELGARRIRLLVTRRTIADHTNVPRLQAIATEAAEQTGRLDTPQVLAPEKLDRMLAAWDPARRLMFCDEAGDDPVAEWGGPEGRARPVLEVLGAGDAAPGQPWALLIGPEGGFDPVERNALRSLPFVAPVTLGPRILRADTAAISALTLWQAVLGDWTGVQLS